MKKMFKKFISTVLAASMLLTTTAVSFVDVSAATGITAAGGWYETMFAELDVAPSTVTSVTWSGTASGSISTTKAYENNTKSDFDYLVRSNGSGGTRIDIPGVKPGTYTLSIATSSGTYSESVTVYEYDRKGYAHYDASKAGVSGVGAYKNDGTLKSNAVVIYVTESNKNTVTVPGMSNSPVGIGNILNYKSTDNGGTSNSSSAKADALKTLAGNGQPLVVRVIGTVKAGDSNTRSDSVTNILGLTQYDGTGNGGTEGDNGMVARMYNAQNVTIEGIGTDANINGWGFQVLSGSARPSQSIEFRNLTFTSTPEDAIGLEGTSSDSSSPQTKEWIASPIKFCWVHNCTFEPGYCKSPAESDKAEGDGSLDFKRGYGFTQSYNHYHGNHKTNLIGSGKTSIQYDVTYHHNYYEEVWSRQPLARQANIHIYNSYFKNGANTSYIISPRAYAYIFSEGNYFDKCKNPVEAPSEGTGWVKSYNDNFAACTEENYATIVTSRTTAVSGCTNPYKSDFDSSTGPYDGDYTVTSAVQAKADCLAKAGVMKAPSEIVMGAATPTAIVSEYPTAPISLPYTLDLTATYAAGRTVVNNSILNLASKSSGNGEIKIRDEGVIFMVNQQATVTFSSGTGSKYGMELADEFGVSKASIATSGSTSVVVDPGTYILRSGNVEKDAYLQAFSVKAVSGSQIVTVTTQATEATTEATTQSAVNTTQAQNTTEEQNHDVNGEGYIWNPTAGENTDDFFTADGNWYTSGSVTYSGATLTKAIKMESTTDIHFTADTEGTLYVYTYSTKTDPTIKLDDSTETILANGLNTFDIGYEHTVYITKGTTSTYIYFMQFVPKSTSTEVTTEATTAAAATTTVAETSTEATTTTQAPTPSSSVKVSADNVNASVGSSVSVPVVAESSISDTIGGYIVALGLDSGLTYDSVVDASSDGIIVDYAEGNAVVVAYVGSVSPNQKLFDIKLTATKTGTMPITVVTQQIINSDMATLGVSSANGSVTASYSVTGSGNGDVNGDNKRDEIDAAYVLKYIAGEDLSGISGIDVSKGNCDGNGTQPDMLDVVYILSNKSDDLSGSSSGGNETTNGLAAGTYAPADIRALVDSSSPYVTSAAHSLTNNELKVRSGKYITITSGVTGTMTVNYDTSTKVPTVSCDGVALTPTTTASGTYTYTIEAGKTYKIEGSTSSNTTITSIVLAES